MQRKDNKIDALEKKVKELQEQLEASSAPKEDKKKQPAAKKTTPTVRQIRREVPAPNSTSTQRKVKFDPGEASVMSAYSPPK